MNRFLIKAALPVAALALGGLAGAAPGLAGDDESITLVSWGGAWGRAVEGAYSIPFTEKTGTKVNMIDYNGGIAEIRAQVEAGNVTWDVVDLIPVDAIRACDEGLLIELPIDTLPKDDFVPGTLMPCGVGEVTWATVVAYRTDKYPENAAPQNLGDFWDTAKFPGRRGLRKVAEVNFEWALMADGVAPDQVYDMLTTEDGVNRALASLGKLKDDALWWEAGAQAPQILADGEVAMTSAYNGRIYNAQKNENQPFKILWNTQVFDTGYMTVVKGAPHEKAAIEYAMSVADPVINANITKYIAYGPVRFSSMPLVDPEVAKHLPSYGDNFKDAFTFDSAFWSEHKDELQEIFTAWLAK